MIAVRPSPEKIRVRATRQDVERKTLSSPVRSRRTSDRSHGITPVVDVEGLPICSGTSLLLWLGTHCSRTVTVTTTFVVLRGRIVPGSPGMVEVIKDPY